MGAARDHHFSRLLPMSEMSRMSWTLLAIERSPRTPEYSGHVGWVNLYTAPKEQAECPKKSFQFAVSPCLIKTQGPFSDVSLVAYSRSD